MNIWSEIREWIQLLFIVTGGILAVRAYFQNLQQRRVENALKFIQLFRDALEPDDLMNWKQLFKDSSELAGAPIGQYISHIANAFRPISDYFSEGAPDNQTISRMAQSLDVVCHQVITGVADARTVYYELGQLLDSMQTWLCSVPGNEVETSLSDSFPSIMEFYKSYKKNLKNWPFRIYCYVE